MKYYRTELWKRHDKMASISKQIIAYGVLVTGIFAAGVVVWGLSSSENLQKIESTLPITVVASIFMILVGYLMVHDIYGPTQARLRIDALAKELGMRPEEVATKEVSEIQRIGVTILRGDANTVMGMEDNLPDVLKGMNHVGMKMLLNKAARDMKDQIRRKMTDLYTVMLEFHLVPDGGIGQYFKKK